MITSQKQRQEKKASGTSLLNILRKRGRRIFGGYYPGNETAERPKVTMSGSMPGFGGGDGVGYGEGRERGARRKKIAGYLRAANDLRQSYQQSYTEKWGGGEVDSDTRGIPGAFPEASIVSHGDEELMLFPSYAKWHTKEAPNPDAMLHSSSSDAADGPGDAEYWAREWQKFEDDRAIVDVDVRGWIYSPHKGPLTRRHRLLIGLARQLSGIPAPRTLSRETSPDAAASLRGQLDEHEARRDQEKIAREAEEILKRGEGEEAVAAQGGYSERPNHHSDSESIYSGRSRNRSNTPGATPDDNPGMGLLSKRPSWNPPSDMTQAELVLANTNLMARLKPFMTNPLVSTAVTLFFYNENSSVSRTVITNEAGHFSMRAGLTFVPTHVRVLASENLSATEKIKITEPKGVSLISDVDDTIKHSSIGSGAREIFRNAFIRDLQDLTIDGVKEWYNTLHDMGVGVHYVSNSPWQLFPVLVTFFQIAGLPPGSFHLKQYSGMLQGIFEPVAERKKGTLEKIMQDFPERRFILVGDSGEADLEVYTDVVLANPGRVIAVFIRDVTTPVTQGYFDSSMSPLSGNHRRDKVHPSSVQSGDSRRVPFPSSLDAPEERPALPPRNSDPTSQRSNGPIMGNLIDFADEPEQMSALESQNHDIPRSMAEFDPKRRYPPFLGRVPPPRPSKPVALQGLSLTVASAEPQITMKRGSPPPPPKPRRTLTPKDSAPSHPLSQAQSSADMATPNGWYLSSALNRVSAAYNALPEVKSYMPGYGSSSGPQPPAEASSIRSGATPPLPPRSEAMPFLPHRPSVPASAPASASASNRVSWNTNTGSSDDESSGPQGTGTQRNKKLDLWNRRWIRAKDILDSQGVQLRSWRVGGDVSLEAVQMVEKAMREMGIEGYVKADGQGKNGKGKEKEGMNKRL